MASEAEPQPEAQAQAPAQPDQPADSVQKPPVKRSWRRKYRKMRAKFEETMSASNNMILDEWKAQALSRRLREQNDQILDILLDMNDTARQPARLRIDLRDLSQTDATSPLVDGESEPEAIQQKLNELRAQLSSGDITTEEYSQRADQLHNAAPVQLARSLTSLEAKVPHTSEAPDPPIDGIDLTEQAPGYMSSLHEEEYLLALDEALANPTYNPDTQDGRPLRLVSTQSIPTEKDLTVRNPDSVYNWLRKNQPQVFLQDKDQPHPENLSEAGATRGKASGRGKRQSAVSGTPGPRTDQEDDDFAPEAGVKGRRGKGGEEDGAYRPKGGTSRSAKRKREDGDVGGKVTKRKNRASAGTAA